MGKTIALRPETAELYEVVDYNSTKDETFVQGFGNIRFSTLTPEACAALLSRHFPFLKAKPEKAAAKTLPDVPKTEKPGKAE